MYGRPQLKWHKSGDGWALHCQARHEPVLHVVPHEAWPGMWRVQRPDGSLTDMANLSWAQDGGIAIALGTLNRGQDMREPSAGRSPMRPILPPGIRWPWAAEGLSTGYLRT